MQVKWDFIGTVLWGVVIGVLMAIGQILPIYFYALLMMDEGVGLSILRGYMNLLEQDAFLLSLSAIGSTIFTVPLVLLIAKFKKDTTIKEYFGFNAISFKSLVFWSLMVVLFLILEGLVMKVLDVPETPNFMLSITYPSELSKWLLLIGVAFFAPILEEVIFRGFLFKGFSQSFLGVIGSVVLTSLIWAFIHFQYELVYLIFIFFTGLLLGYARIKSNSLFVPIVMHIVFNFIAVVGLYWEQGVL